MKKIPVTINGHEYESIALAAERFKLPGHVIAHYARHFGALEIHGRKIVPASMAPSSLRLIEPVARIGGAPLLAPGYVTSRLGAYRGGEW